jgi:hypothetical protein
MSGDDGARSPERQWTAGGPFTMRPIVIARDLDYSRQIDAARSASPSSTDNTYPCFAVCSTQDKVISLGMFSWKENVEY